MAEIDPEIIKKTQDSLGKYIKKPPLTEKLLSRPPFRFLHDIVTAVISHTGFMKGLFTDLEMNSENVKEKEGKVQFLDKLIGIVSLVLNTPIDVKTSSIVAGKEPEKTNFLLQSLGLAIGKKVDNNVYVKKTLNGEAKSLGKSNASTKETTERPKKEPSGDNNKSQSKSKKESTTESKQEKSKKPPNDKEMKKDDSRRKEKLETLQEKIVDQKEIAPADDVDKTKRSKETVKTDEKPHRKERRKERPVEEPPAKEKEQKEPSRHKPKPEKPISNDDIDEPMIASGDLDRDSAMKADAAESEAMESSKKLPRPSSAKGTRQRHENEQLGIQDQREHDNKRPFPRPPSARPAPPKVRKSNDVPLDEGLNAQSKVSGLIIDMDQDSDDGDFVVEEFIGGGEVDMKFMHSNATDNSAMDADEKHGMLVQKIMESKKEFSNDATESTTPSANVANINRKRERLIVEKDIEKLCKNLQLITKSVHPLGKLIDFVQEDLDTMQKEAERWNKENDELSLALQNEQSVTDKLIQPLKEKFNEQILLKSQQEEAIAKLKSKIEENSRKIETMLCNICLA